MYILNDANKIKIIEAGLAKLKPVRYRRWQCGKGQRETQVRGCKGAGPSGKGRKVWLEKPECQGDRTYRRNSDKKEKDDERKRECAGISLNTPVVCIYGGGCIYTGFARVYDSLMKDVDYPKWADYIKQIFKARGIQPELVLDIGCGTGSLCMEMTRNGYEMIGLDMSADMLACAKEKAVERNYDILFLNQDMTRFELYGTVDAVLCMMDSLNYITDRRNVKKVFKLVRNYLNPGGLFIFDLNTEYKLGQVLGNNTFYEVGDNVSYIWQNSYDRRSRRCFFDLTFFVREGDLFRKYEEVHTEKAYGAEDIKSMLVETGFERITIYDELTFCPPKKDSSRIFFVCSR